MQISRNLFSVIKPGFWFALSLLAGCNSLPGKETVADAPALSQSQPAKDLSADGLFLWGNAYERGNGVAQSYDEAFKYYQLAAEQGHAPAQFYLGAMYASGRAVKHDYVKAVAWYRKSAEQGYKDAFYPMGYAYEFGIGLEKDAAQSVAWYRRSADAGVWQAMLRLGQAYEKGELGLPLDQAKAKEWQDKASAARGGAQSMTVPIKR